MAIGGIAGVDNFADFAQRANGFFDYNDAATAITPISITGGAGAVKLTNDELGPFTNKLFTPTTVTDVWDATANEFDWSELNLGDQVGVRIDIEVTTTSPNQNVRVFMRIAIGSGNEYEIEWFNTAIKSAGANRITRYNQIYMGDTDTQGNTAEFQIESDGNATVVVNGWYTPITLRS